MKEINNILKELFSLKQDYRTKNLEKITKLVDFLDNPHLDYPVVHIAGTNGKGSVCSMLASVLKESGYKVGLYTSPHILKFNERIKINGKCISDEEIANIYKSIRNLSSEIEASFFDITTAIGFKYFSDEKVDIAFIETGLGGRLDSTNIVNPIVSIITSISEDHSDILGENIIDIAKEKAGIIKKNIPVVIQDKEPQIVEVFVDKANELDSTLFLNYDFPVIEFSKYEDYQMMYSVDKDIILFRIDDAFLFDTKTETDEKIISLRKRITPLLGKHQIENIKSVGVACLLIRLNGFKIGEFCIERGIENVIKNTGLQYRITNISETKTPIILDVAHNEESMLALVHTLYEMHPHNKWNFIFAAMKDKNIKDMLQLILPICKKLTIVQPKMERAATTKDIQKIAKELGFNDIEISDIATACKNAKSHTEPCVICGTFYIIKEVVEAFQLESSNSA